MRGEAMAKILFADDDSGIREVVSEILSREGYQVVVAKDGPEVLVLAKSDKPDLIISDFQMPGLNGIDVCKRLKADDFTKNIPVIMVTGYPSEKEESLNAGAFDFIAKPIDKTDLLLRIKCVLKVSNISNELQKVIGYIQELEKK
jgi:CheY-like chemotaxis protein